jgi:hypothetical protein
MLENIITNQIKNYKYKTKERLKLTNHAKNIDTYFNKLRNEYKADVFNRIKKQTSKDKIIEHLSTRDSVTLNKFKNYIFSLGYGNQAFSNIKLKHILEELGYNYNIMLDKFIKQIQ